MAREPQIAYWAKDGRWHITGLYIPTEADRRQYPASYPLGDDGPFYRWSSESFDTKTEAANELVILAGLDALAPMIREPR